MKKLTFLLLAACIGAGCEKKPAEAPSSPGQGRGRLGQEEAMQLIWKLPEVAVWSQRVESKSGGKVLPVCKAEHTPGDAAVGGRAVWVFYFGESHKTHLVLWNRFEVDAHTGDIRVWNPLRDSYETLDRWRGTDGL